MIVNALDGFYMIAPEQSIHLIPDFPTDANFGMSVQGELVVISCMNSGDDERVELLVVDHEDEAPVKEDQEMWAAGWQSVSLASVRASQPLHVVTSEHEPVRPLTTEPGTYRLLLHGRQAEADWVEPDEPREQHMLVVWRERSN